MGDLSRSHEAEAGSAPASSRRRILLAAGCTAAAAFFGYAALTSGPVLERAIGAGLCILAILGARDYATGRATPALPRDDAVEHLSLGKRVLVTLLFSAAALFWGFCGVIVASTLLEHAFCLFLAVCFASVAARHGFFPCSANRLRGASG